MDNLVKVFSSENLNEMGKVVADATLNWVLNNGLSILLILLGVYLFKKFAGIFIEKFIRKIIVSDKFLSKQEEVKREDTLIRIVSNFANVTIYIVAFLLILEECGVQVGPIIAAAGIVGVALGLGGQYIIKDLISGLFIIIENQYRVGDVICLGENCGTVEDVTLRMTTLRDLDGSVHHIPHGQVTSVSNLSKYYSRVNLNINVSYSADLDKVIKVVNKVGNDLAKDPAWQEFITKAPQFLRVDNFGDSAVVVKILGETKALKQWEVTGELRRRIKIAFDKEKIVIPFPQMVIHKSK